MNKIDIKDKKIIDIASGESLEYYLYNEENDLVINLSYNAELKLHQYSINKSFNIEVNLNGEESSFEYHFSTINYTDNNVSININHNSSNTISNIYNHGVNIKNNRLHFDVCGKVEKDASKCVCNQENQIINLEDGQSTILPKLLIDNYDVSSSHAAYIGKFKDDKIFYLMSRGISKKQSYKLLIDGFLINKGDTDKEEVRKFKKEIENL